ncbi:TolC family protein [Rickettsiaceae bacterium]|nr:TolC family protein [Rickettsiaceae bacterium]
MHKKALLLCTLLFYITTASALTMEQALVSAYNHNEDLKISRTEFLTEIESFPRALAGFMPHISANFSSTNSRISERGSNQPNSDSKVFAKSITLDQPIFDGWSSVAELKSAQSSVLASRSGYYAKEQDTFLKIINTYLDCVETKEKYEISKVSVASNKTQLKSVEVRLKLGESTKTELASAREGFATAEANEAFAYANYETAKANFDQVFGIEAVNVQMPELPSGLPESLEFLKEKAASMNPSIDSARNKVKASKAAEYASQGVLLPKASFQIKSSRTKYNPKNQLSSDATETNSTLSVTVPILAKGGIEYSDIRRAKYQLRQNVMNLDSIMKQVKSRVKSNWSEFNAAKLRVVATAQAVSAAEIAYAGTTQEKKLGTKTVIDVLRAEEKLHKALESKVEARKALVLSAYKIKSLIGELTAKSMKLDVDYFDPNFEFKKAKLKIIGY